MTVDVGAAPEAVYGIVRVIVCPVGPQCLQNVTVVVQVSVQISVVGKLAVSTAAAVVSTATAVEMGLVRVTVVGVAAQCVQTVTVVVQPSGIEADVVASPVAGPVTLAVASGHQVVVSVVVIVVNPVGQMSVYDVTMTVVVTSPDAVGVAVTEGVTVAREVMVLDPAPFPVV